MISIISGENSFEITHFINVALAKFVAKNGDLAVERIDGEEVEYPRLQEALQGLPFLSSEKLVILRQPSKNKQFLEKFESLLTDLPESNEIIIVESKLDKRSAYYKYLKRQPKYVEYPILDANAMVRWVTTEVQKAEGILSQADARLLVDRVGLRQQFLSHEIDKLLLYNPHITRESIELLTEKNPQSTIFELLESAFAGNTARTINLYAEQRALKVEPQQIVALLAWQLHILALITAAGTKSADNIAADAKLSPYVVRKSMGVARNLSFSKVKALVHELLQIDIKTKSEAIDYDEVLQNYLLKIALAE
jgi:DNA polymerase-3 subunit delta